MSAEGGLPAAGSSRVMRWLARLRRATRTILWVERASAALWPAMALVGFFACLALFGVPQSLPAVAHVLLLLALAAGLVWTVRRVRKELRWPALEAADRRLEREAGLPHRPLSVLADRPAGEGGPLWGWHQARALTQVGRLRLGWPHPAFPTRDPRALRLLLLLGLTIGVVTAGPDASDRIWRALVPHFAPGPAPVPLELRAWVTPPSYTFLPPSLLPEGGAVTVPAGSRLTIGLSGGSGGAPSLSLGGQDHGFEPIGDNSFQAEAEPTQDGALVVRRDGADIARWTMTVRPDVAPVVAWARPPAVVRGRVPQTRLAWKASHAYGVTAMSAEFRLRERPSAPPLMVPLSIPGHPREATGATTTDLTAHPWAGLPVTVTLSGRDGAGLVGHGESVPFVLPERRFRQPGAQALVAVRKMLALAPQDGTGAAAALRDAAGRPLWPEGDTAPDDARAIASSLDGTPSDKAVDAAQAQLWALALRLEEGTVQRTAEALRRAQQDLHAALDPASPKEARDKAEIERRAERAGQGDAAARNRLWPTRPAAIPGVRRRSRRRTRRRRRRNCGNSATLAQANKDDEARERMAELDEMLERDAPGRAEPVPEAARRRAGEGQAAESRAAGSGPPAGGADRPRGTAPRRRGALRPAGRTRP